MVVSAFGLTTYLFLESLQVVDDLMRGAGDEFLTDKLKTPVHLLPRVAAIFPHLFHVKAIF